jgi:hypothetical protein
MKNGYKWKAWLAEAIKEKLDRIKNEVS